ncbi:MAG: hypothetical protein KC618_04275 [Candidatus Omnitrophica bacterium]|nr:hypothetical protein [Candidatus Omnitrophota bacterium]
MKKFFLFLSMVALTVAGLSVNAQASPKDNVDLAAEVYYFNYEEPGFMEDTGMFYGLAGVYTRYFSSFLGQNATVEDDPFLLQFDGRFAFGIVDYTSVNSGSLDGINDFVFEGRILGGYEAALGKMTILKPYTGIGYRYLNDDSSGEITTTGHAGYERESNYIYIPVGVDLVTPITTSWTFGVNVEFDIFLYGRQKSHLGDAVAGLNSVENDQDQGYGARGSLELRREDENFDIFIEPFVRFWHIDDSDISPITYGGVLTGYGLEPENETLETGLRLGLNF